MGEAWRRLLEGRRKSSPALERRMAWGLFEVEMKRWSLASHVPSSTVVNALPTQSVFDDLLLDQHQCRIHR